MSMADDYERLNELELTKGTLQYGQNLLVTLAAGADLVIASKDLIRFVGDKTDVNAWRVYLGPWQPQPMMPVPPILVATEYADPTPWAPPQPTQFDSFPPFPCYARVMWGSGGIQHTAYVDWPRRGLLLQVSGSYLQVNAFVDTSSATPHVPATANNLPLLQATLGPEPGGGDALNPATFTYPNQNAQESGGVAQWVQNFQVPPFARAFVPVMDFSLLVSSGGNLKISTQGIPQPIGSIGNNDRQIWETPIGGVYDQELFTAHPLPIGGQEIGSVRFEVTPGGPAALASFGCMFFLDL